MPEAQILPFRVIEGGKAAEAPAVDVDKASRAEVREVLKSALKGAKAGEWSGVIVIFRDGSGDIDTCYSGMNDQERNYMIDWAKKILLHED